MVTAKGLLAKELDVLDRVTVYDIVYNRPNSKIFHLINLVTGEISSMPLYRDNYKNVINFLKISPQIYQAPNEVKDDEPIETRDIYIWSSFFNRCFEVTEQEMKQGNVSNQDIVDMESYLFIGLPSITVLDGLIRSLALTQGIQFARGFVLKEETCSPEHLQMYQGLEKIKLKLKDADLSQPDIEELKRVTLCSEDYRANESHPKFQQIVVISSLVRGIGITISQMGFYKEKFTNVMEALSQLVFLS